MPATKLNPKQISNPNDATKYLRGDGTWQTLSPGGDYTWVVKATDENLTSTNTLQDDDELYFNATANKSYHVILSLIGLGTWGGTEVVGGIKAPSLFNGYSPFKVGFVDSAGVARVLEINSYSPTPVQLFGSNTYATFNVSFVLRIGSVGGTVKLRWCQSVSDSIPVAVLAGSCIGYKQLD